MQSNWVIEKYRPLLLNIIHNYLSGVRVALLEKCSPSKN